jgi:hypothetical protein
LQVNSQAKNDSLVKFKQKERTHANLASGTINENTPAETQEEEARKLWENIGQASKGETQVKL